MTVTIAALVYSLTAWINSTGMITPVWPGVPLMVQNTTAEGMALAMQRCYAEEGIPEETWPTQDALLDYAANVHAIYCHDAITFNRDHQDLSTPEGQAVFVHELVHWLQDHNGDADRADAAGCPQALEYDAYMIHMHWQAIMGVEQYPDKFTALMQSQCQE